MPEFGLTGVLVAFLESKAAGGLASRAGEIFAWVMATMFLLAGAHSLRFFDRTTSTRMATGWAVP